MSAPQRLPALRVKLPCDDEKDFFSRLADAIAEKGLRVPTANLRPVGSRVRLVLEFRNAETVSGEGVIDAHLEGARPGMNIRILRFERSRPGAAPGAGQAAAATPAPAVTPAPQPPASSEAPAPAQEVAAPSAPEPAAAPPPETSFESLFDDEPHAEPPGADIPRPAAEDSTRQLEPISDAGAASEPTAGGARAPAPEPTPPPQSVVAPKDGALPPASRRAIVGAAVAAVVLIAGVLAYSFARQPPPAAPPPPSVPAPAVAVDAQVAERIAASDRRLAEGRLSGPDGALDHLLAAKALAPGDPRVKERLALLADTLEKLGARALDRGDVAEAEVHLAAALQAAPDRASVSEKLDALAKVPKAREARSRGDQPAPAGEGK